ncbi:MAG: adenosine kinase [Promethearchaeota archaeon]
MDFIGFGAVLWDSLVYVGYSFLDEIGIVKGGYRAVDFPTLKQLLERINAEKDKKVITDPGGSCANVMSNIAKLGSSVTFVGKHGDDAEGYKFMNLLESEGVNTYSVLDKEKRTGQVLSLITPDKDRALIAHLGAAEVLPAEAIDEALIRKADITHLEGYLVANSEPALWKIFEAADKVSIDLAAATIIQQHKPVLQKLMKHHRPYILFANEFEGKEFTGKEDYREIVERLLDYAEIAVLTLGEKGAIAATRKGDYHFEKAIKTNPVDTTGAGDSFCAGFLHTYHREGDIALSAKLSVQIASATIRYVGARSFRTSQLKDLFG